VDRFTEAVDLMPTLLDRLELEIPAQVNGRSLMPFARGETPPNWRREAHYEYDFLDVVNGRPEKGMGLMLDQCSLAAIRDEDYKYIHFAGQHSLLFDLNRDPGALENRADNPDYAVIALNYACRMLNWRMEHAHRALTGTHLTDDGAVVRSHHERAG
jgi:arylsulfatase A-like enzyme